MKKRLVWACLALAALAARPAPAAPGASSTATVAQNSPAGAYRLAAGDQLAITLTQAPLPEGRSQKIEPRDQLQVSYQFATSLTEGAQYKIQPLDEVSLYFRYSPDFIQNENRTSWLTRTYTVPPDGVITLIGINKKTNVRNLTAEQVQKIAREAYKPLLQDSDVAVGVNPKYRQSEIFFAGLGLYQRPFPIEVPDDGKLSLPFIHEVAAAGKTIQQLGEELTGRYRELGYPLLVVNVWHAKIADARFAQLRRQIENTGSRAMVDPAGRVSLPLCADYPAGGKTAAQLGGELTEFYRDKGFDRAEASVSVAAPRSQPLRVLGAVRAPGAYAASGATDLWGAVALAGGFAAGADTARVTVIPAPGEAPLGPFNFQEFIKTGARAQAPTLNGGETVFVPQKGEQP